MLYKYFLVFAILCYKCRSAKILGVFPTPMQTHQLVFRSVIKELLKQGHQLVILTPMPMSPKEKVDNLTEINLHDVSYGQKTDVPFGHEDDQSVQIKTVFTNIIEVFKNQWLDKEVQQLVRNTRDFDLMLLESWVIPAIGVTHVYKIPTIRISSLGTTFEEQRVVGGVEHPIYYPNFIRQNMYDIDFFGTIKELYNYYRRGAIIDASKESSNKILIDVFGNVPSVDDLNDNVEMIMLNVNLFWDNNRPVPQNLLRLGDIHEHLKEKLPMDIKNYLDSSLEGVIYISFGTNVFPSTFPLEKLNVFWKVLSKLPYDILFKWDNDGSPVKSKNIKFSKWFPQTGILAHPKTKLFITQGGLHSIDEAIASGVPMIGIPMFMDQWYNDDKINHFKLGRKVSLEYLTEDVLRNAIIDVIGNVSYRANVEKFRKILQDKRFTGLEVAIWGAERMLRGKVRAQRSPAAMLNPAQYYELELLAIVLSVIVAILILICKVFKKLGVLVVCYNFYKDILSKSRRH